MKINIDFQPTEKDKNEAKGQTIQAIVLGYIDYAIVDTHKTMEGQMRRIYGRLQRKFDKAVDENLDEIELEEAEKDLIKKSFKEAKFPAAMSKYVNVLEEEIEKL